VPAHPSYRPLHPVLLHRLVGFPKPFSTRSVTLPELASGISMFRFSHRGLSRPPKPRPRRVTPFTTRPCWAQTRRWSGRAHERRLLNARAGGLAPIRAGLLGVINGGRLSTDEQAIRDVVASWHRATAAGDVETVLKLMAEDVVFLVAGHPPMRGRSSFERGLRGLLSQNRIESTGEIQEIAVSGDLAYCWTALIVRIVPIAGGTATVRTGSALSIFRKQPDGSWVVARDANMLSAAPP
jgi:uncharacterized protein (TIGR02246 family)